MNTVSDVNPLRRGLELRARLYAAIRAYFAAQAVIEVETPILSVSGNTDPNIENFSTQFSGPVAAGSRTRYLRTSPEFPLKRLLAAGIGDCYELGRVFRNGEVGRSHNPEFTMLEWYRVGWDHARLIDEVCALAQLALGLVGKKADIVKVSYREMFIGAFGFDPLSAPEQTLLTALAGIQIDTVGLGRDDYLDLLISHRLQPQFPRDRISVIYDYPASQCALARIRAGDPPVAERFEIFLGRHEVANGYHELTDAAEQRARFERENLRRREGGRTQRLLDERLLEALRAGLPECSGVALGVERLLMGMLGSDDIREVLAFDFTDA